MIPSNFSPDEIIRYCNVPAEIVPFLEGQAGTIVELESELALAHRELESVSEQAYFARELIAEIDELLKRNTRLADFAKAYRIARENSMFEV